MPEFYSKTNWGMLLVAGPASEYVKFIQILCWIILPVLFITVGVTVYMHYRKKKRETDDSDTENAFMQANPELVGYTNGDGQYVLFDCSGIIKEYKNKLTYNHARFTALQQDYTAVKSRYTALAMYAQTRFKTKKEVMKNEQEKLPAHLQAEINKLTTEHENERKELMSSMDQLNQSYRKLEEENKSLQAQIVMQSGSEEEKSALMNQWKEENTALKDKVADQEYLEDLVEEKKAQVVFLQGQLEQRIKNLYQSEHQRLQTLTELKQFKETYEDIKKDIEASKNDLLMKQEQIDKMQVVLCQKEEQLAEKKQELNAKLEHITTLENALKETKEQNEQLNTDAAASKDFAGILQQQLTDEHAKSKLIEQKQAANEQMLRRLYKEFSGYIETLDERSPVIALRREYNTRPTEETAM